MHVIFLSHPPLFPSFSLLLFLSLSFLPLFLSACFVCMSLIMTSSLLPPIIYSYIICVCVCTCVCLINMYYNGVYICVIIVLIIVDNGLSHAVLTRDGVTSFTIIKLTDISTAYSLSLPLIRACIAPHTSHLPAAVCLTLSLLSLSCRTLLRRRSSTYAAVNRQNSSVGTGDAPPPPANKW